MLFVERTKHRRAAADMLSAKVQDHEVRITVLENDAQWGDRKRRTRQ